MLTSSLIINILQQIKHNIKKIRKFRLLLDAGFASSDSFPKLRKKTNLAHCVFDGKLSAQAADLDIYQLAIQQNRFVITHDKDFKLFVKPNKPGIFILPSHLSNAELDTIVTIFFSTKNPENFIGKAIRI